MDREFSGPFGIALHATVAYDGTGGGLETGSRSGTGGFSSAWARWRKPPRPWAWCGSVKTWTRTAG